MRILVVQNIENWTAAISEEEFLNIPDTMDVKREEEQWFASGGGVFESFVNHLVSRGAQKIEVEIWPINYQ